MLEQWLSDPSKIGATVLLLGAVYSFARGFVVPRWTFDLFIQEHQKALDRVMADCQRHKDMNERLLRSNDKALSAGDAVAQVAATVVQKQS